MVIVAVPAIHAADSCRLLVQYRLLAMETSQPAGEVLAQHSTAASRVWTVAEAKARLSHILRCAESEGPQRIGTRKTFVVVPEAVWKQHAEPEPEAHLGRWLLENMPRGYELELPDRRSSRATPFIDDAAETAAETPSRS